MIDKMVSLIEQHYECQGKSLSLFQQIHEGIGGSNVDNHVGTPN